MINLKAPYQPRPIRFLELFEFQGGYLRELECIYYSFIHNTLC